MLDKVRYGKAAEYIFIAKCLLLGYECFLPVSEGSKVDVIVGKYLHRCQIKVIREKTKELTLRKIGVNTKSKAKISRYSKDDIDFFVGVDLQSLDVYVVPIEFSSRYRATISVNVLEKAGYKNNLDILGLEVRLKDTESDDSAPALKWTGVA